MPGTVYNSSPAQNSFIVPINTMFQFLTNSDFYTGTSPPGPGYKGFYPQGYTVNGVTLPWETNNPDFAIPTFGLLTTNRLQVFMLGGIGAPYHVIDYVQFAGPNSSRNLNAELQTSVAGTGFGYIWCTTSNTAGVPWGIVNQIDVSLGADSTHRSDYWKDGEAANEISGFSQFMGHGMANNTPTAQFYATNNPAQVPYTPSVTTSEYISWQANDPLVHYLASDLNFQGTEIGGTKTGITVTNTLSRPSFNLWNERYQPWGRTAQMGDATVNTAIVDQNPANLAFKDPLVRMSDNWDFPGNKFPTVGWLGRVHRGTPWQTVYLKASDILTEINAFGSNIGTNTWVKWTGNTNLTFSHYFDAPNAAPKQDRLLFDLFTTAFNDNATRGTLSVNAGPTNANLAAWSAMFSGVVAISNNSPETSTDFISVRPQFQTSPPSNSWLIVQPAGLSGLNSALGQLVQGINNTHTVFTNDDGLVGTFEHVGDILATPQLTEQSPFLHLSNYVNNVWVNDQVQKTNGISDEMYEWLPQQTMSLLRCSSSPRYVIYCYGQALKPAPNSVLTSGGQYFGMITNYQVVSEIATRAVVRFNNTVTNNLVFDVNTTNWISVPVMTNNNAVIESFNMLPPD
jgi:hypothetical protein